MKTTRLFALLAAVTLLGWSRQAGAQWITQTNTLKAGWNSVYLHVDATHATIDELVGANAGNPIQEIWLWMPSLPTGQFIDSPLVPTGSSVQWLSWARLNGPTSPLQHLTGNAAYLVRVASNVVSYSWAVKGKLVPPSNKWTLTGLNFVGFSTPTAVPPSFDAFLAPATELRLNAEIYSYHGGELGAGNPARIFALRTAEVRRDQAYWMRAGDSYNRYFGPFELDLQGASGIRFHDSGGQAQLRIRNVTDSPLTVTLRQLNSETPPPGQTNIQGAPPLLLRGAVNTTNLTFSYTSLSGSPQAWTLAPQGQPGSEAEVVLGLNRSQMIGSPGALYAGILRFTDSLNLAQVDVPISAEVASNAGLWVGEASVGYVSQYLKRYAHATNSLDFQGLLARLGLTNGLSGYRYEWDPISGRVLVFGGPNNKTGSYLLDGPIKLDSGVAASPFPLRLIIHNDGGTTRLLQQVYHGLGVTSNNVIATKESLLLASDLIHAQRISAVHLPVLANNLPWNFTGAMQMGGSMTATVNLAYDDQASNPFLHTYHPDHDNLDPSFTVQQAQGVESYGVRRQITLTFGTPTDDFNSRTRDSQTLTGNYAEVVTFLVRGGQIKEHNVLGTFTLKRISDIASLTTQ